ncbi:MAG: hypothetical protein ACRDFB_10695, partial [Rhabdochlamydiaceae bacterium]
NLPEKKDRCVLLVGTDSSTVRLQGVRLMGGEPQEQMMLFPNGHSKTVTQYQIQGQPLPFDFFSDDPNSSGVYVYGNILEAPILAPLSPPEDDVCLGVATEFVISHFAPQRIVVCIPRDFFQFSSSNKLLQKVSKFYESLRRIVWYPTSTRESILFVINDQQDGQNVASQLKDEIIFGVKLLASAISRSKSSSLTSFVKSLFGIVSVEIEEAIDAYMFIVSRLTFSSKITLEDILTKQETNSASCPKVHIYRGLSNTIEYSNREQNISLQDLSLHSFDMKNISLNSAHTFKRVLTIALRYMRHIENEVVNLESQFLTSLQLFKSIDRILNLLRKKEIGEIDKTEAEAVLGKAVSEEIAN